MDRQLWEASAEAWIKDQGERGDWSREYVLDPALKPLFQDVSGASVLDIGCGEGRFARWLDSQGAKVVGADPTARLVESGRGTGGGVQYVRALGTPLPFRDSQFDCVLFYLVLIDIPEFVDAIGEAARVLNPGGKMVVANMNGFATSTVPLWERDPDGRKRIARLDEYMTPQAQRVSWRGIDIINHHRPLRDYMQAFLGTGLELRFFDQPEPVAHAPGREDFLRAPFFNVMVWQKPLA